MQCIHHRTAYTVMTRTELPNPQEYSNCNTHPLGDCCTKSRAAYMAYQESVWPYAPLPVLGRKDTKLQLAATTSDSSWHSKLQRGCRSWFISYFKTTIFSCIKSFFISNMLLGGKKLWLRSHPAKNSSPHASSCQVPLYTNSALCFCCLSTENTLVLFSHIEEDNSKDSLAIKMSLGNTLISDMLLT